MADVGLQVNTVDTQQVTLTNVTDSDTYSQATVVNFSIDSNVEKNQLSNGSIDNVFSLYMNYIEGNMRVTTPEWADLVVLTIDVDGARPSKLWRVDWTNDVGGNVNTTFNGQLKTLKTVDAGLGKLELFYRLEADEVVSVA